MMMSLMPFEATIRWIKKETRDTSTYGLLIRDRDIQRSYRFTPGQFNMLYVPSIGEAPISISSSPDDHDLTHTIRIAGDVTTAIGRLNPGDTIYIRGPFGRGWPIEEAEERDVLIIGGGLGIAPLRSVIRDLLRRQRKKKASKRGKILYGAKSPKDIIFRDEFPRYREFFDVYLTVDKADPEEYWRGETGFVTNLINRIDIDPLNTVAFLCGPEAMMQSVIRELIIKGVPGEKIFLSMERNMNCGLGICGHCMFGPRFVCKDGPVFRFSDIEEFLGIKEI